MFGLGKLLKVHRLPSLKALNLSLVAEGSGIIKVKLQEGGKKLK